MKEILLETFRLAAAPPEGQLPLFPGRPDPRRNLARTVDKIRERFGGEAITRASLLEGSGEPTRKSREPRAESRDGRAESKELRPTRQKARIAREST